MGIEDKCPHCILVQHELEGTDLKTGKRFTKMANYGHVECELVSAKVIIPKEHFNKYCFSEHQKCKNEHKYEEWCKWVK
jgi:hypothetical protein